MAAKGLNRGWPAKLEEMAEMFLQKDQQAFPGRWIYLSRMPDPRNGGKQRLEQGRELREAHKGPLIPLPLALA